MHKGACRGSGRARPARHIRLRFGQCLQPCSNVDAVAVDIVAVYDHVADIDADAEGDALVLGDVGIPVDHRPLDLDRAADRIDHAREFDERPVASQLDDTAPLLLDLRVDQFPAMRLEAFERAFLVRSHQPRVARHIGGQDRGETAFDGLLHGLPQPHEDNMTATPSIE
jgi:hypothetical protein